MTGNTNKKKGIGSKLLRFVIATAVFGMLFAGVAGPAAADLGTESETAESDSCDTSLGVESLNSQEGTEAIIKTLEDPAKLNDPDEHTKIQTITTVREHSIVDLSGGVVLQTNSTSFCQVPYVAGLMNAAFTIFIGGALALGLLTWVVTSFTESLPLPSDTKQTLKSQRNSAIASMFRAVFVPAIIVTLLDLSGLVLPSCIQVLP